MIVGGRKIAIQRQAQAPDGEGGFTQLWANVATERGSLAPGSSRTVTSAGLDQGEVKYTAFLRSGADIEVGDRLTSGSTNVQVLAIRRFESHLEADCVELQGG